MTLLQTEKLLDVNVRQHGNLRHPVINHPRKIDHFHRKILLTFRYATWRRWGPCQQRLALFRQTPTKTGRVSFARKPELAFVVDLSLRSARPQAALPSCVLRPLPYAKSNNEYPLSCDRIRSVSLAR